ncbi:hypothetical protein BUALT_Bualt11G0021600 [Buddleja alternifolia]|uniref:Retrotransposon gag domain-containing protein n=1 Tax=Buddleja alternifolia TaxID=168488 RepID=A0AAV6X0E8_9LAMI|nr:hypothetical protein BUALT_Bualt11G0021600 [Buddleja alternifolia]
MVANLTAAMNRNQQMGVGQGRSSENGEESHNHEEQGLGNQGYQIPTKCLTVEFPKFHREDLRGWVYRCEQFFDVDETSDEAKTGTIQDYLDKFDELMNCLDLSESHAISCFLRGIKHEISVPVRMFKPKTLQEAISLAKL